MGECLPISFNATEKGRLAMNSEIVDQRLFQRFTARFPVKIKDSRNDFGTNVFLKNFSAEGIKLAARERLFLADSLSLSIKLPDGMDPLIVNGHVVWVRTQEPNALWDVGVRLYDVDFMNMQRLLKFIPEDAIE